MVHNHFFSPTWVCTNHIYVELRYTCMRCLWFRWKGNQFPHCTITKSVWENRKWIALMCRAHCVAEWILNYSCDLPRAHGWKNESSQVVSEMGPVRTRSKTNTCKPPPSPVLRHDADVLIIPKISNRLSVCFLFAVPALPIYFRVCMYFLRAIPDMEPLWWLRGQRSLERVHPLIPLNKQIAGKPKCLCRGTRPTTDSCLAGCGQPTSKSCSGG